MPVYKIKSGDNLTKIARQGGYSLAELKAVNPNLNVNKLRVGQKINIPYINYDAFGNVISRPEYDVVPTSRAQIVDMITPEERALLDAIASAEGAGYGSIFGGANIPKLESGQYTLQEVIQMAKTRNLPGTTTPAGYKTFKDDEGKVKESSATGRYQMLGNVLEEEMRGQGIDPNTPFTPELQDRMILGRLKLHRDVGPRNLRQTGLTPEIIDRLSKEFASFPYSGKAVRDPNTGKLVQEKSYYSGQPAKSTQFIIDAYRKALTGR